MPLHSYLSQEKLIAHKAKSAIAANCGRKEHVNEERARRSRTRKWWKSKIFEQNTPWQIIRTL